MRILGQEMLSPAYEYFTEFKKKLGRGSLVLIDSNRFSHVYHAIDSQGAPIASSSRNPITHDKHGLEAIVGTGYIAEGFIMMPRGKMGEVYIFFGGSGMYSAAESQSEDNAFIDWQRAVERLNLVIVGVKEDSANGFSYVEAHPHNAPNLHYIAKVNDASAEKFSRQTPSIDPIPARTKIDLAVAGQMDISEAKRAYEMALPGHLCQSKTRYMTHDIIDNGDGTYKVRVTTGGRNATTLETLAVREGESIHLRFGPNRQLSIRSEHTYKGRPDLDIGAWAKLVQLMWSNSQNSDYQFSVSVVDRSSNPQANSSVAVSVSMRYGEIPVTYSVYVPGSLRAHIRSAIEKIGMDVPRELSVL